MKINMVIMILNMNEGKSKYKWIKLDEIDNYKINPEIMKEKLKKESTNIEHFIYREF